MALALAHGGAQCRSAVRRVLMQWRAGL
jgi:hypothetical protein